MKRNSNLNCSMFLLWTRIHLSSISKKLLKRMIFNTLVALSIRPFYHKLCYIFDIHCIWVSLLNVFIFRNEIYIISILPSYGHRHATAPLQWFQYYMVKYDRMRIFVWFLDTARQWRSHTINRRMVLGYGPELYIYNKNVLKEMWLRILSVINRK